MRRFFYLSLLLLFAVVYSAAQNARQSPDKAEKKINRDPEAVRIVTSDIDNFWKAYDAAKPNYCFGVFQREYSERAVRYASLKVRSVFTCR